MVKWLALALAKIGDPSSLGLIGEKLKTTTDPDARDWLNLARGHLSGLNTKDRLFDLLTSTDPEAIHEGVILAWGNPLLDDSQNKHLGRHIEHVNPSIRRWAVLSLGTTGSIKNASPLLEGLSDPDYLVREWTEYTLAPLKDGAAYTPLLARLGDPHPRVREWAIKAIGSFDQEENARVLMAHYKSEVDDLCKEGIIRALQKWSALAEVRRFLLGQLHEDHGPIVLIALLEVLATSESFKDDPEVINEVIEVGVRNKDTIFAAQVASNIFETASTVEQQALMQVAGSPRLRALVDIIRGEHQGGDLEVSLRKGAVKPKEVPLVGVVIALKEEFREFQGIVGELRAEEVIVGSPFSYSFKFQRLTEQFGVGVASFVGDMGPSRAAVHSDQFIRRWTPELLVNVGIAAGLHSDVRIGDLVVPNQVDHYLESAKAVPASADDSFAFKLAGDSFKPDRSLIENVRNFEFRYPGLFSQWQLACEADLEEALNAGEREFLLANKLVRKRPVILEMPIASGPIVGSAEAFIEWLLSRNRNYRALEMEAAGVLLASEFSRPRGGSSRNPRYLGLRR